LLKESTETTRGCGAVFLDVAKAFDTVWVKGLLYKLTILKFQFYLAKIISSYLDYRTYQTSFQSATCQSMLAGVTQGGLVSPVQLSLYVCDIPTPSGHVELAKYAEDMALVATSRSPSLLVCYLLAYHRRLGHWLWDWRLAINVSKKTAVVFDKAARSIQKPRPS
jgi:hypothetical protein